MDALKIERATVVGHSMGSFVARRVAAQAPARVSRLILVGAGVRSGNEEVQGMRPVVDKLTDPVDPVFVREFQLSTVARPVPPEFIDRAVSESLKLPAAVWKQVLTGLLAYPSSEASIRCPTLVIGGDKDAVFSVAQQEALAKAVDGATLTIVPGVGHALHWEDPERFAKELVGFMGHGATSSGAHMHH
jgi:pimeloyl-ACP methyl ester carboxylesterase